MTIHQIVTSVVTLLAPYLAKGGEEFAKKGGDATWERMKALYQAIYNKFSADKDDYAQQTLKRLEEKPLEESRKRALSDILAEKAEADPEFAQQLKQRVQDTTQGQGVGLIVNRIYDDGKVGQIFNFNQAGDLTVNN